MWLGIGVGNNKLCWCENGGSYAKFANAYRFVYVETGAANEQDCWLENVRIVTENDEASWLGNIGTVAENDENIVLKMLTCIELLMLECFGSIPFLNWLQLGALVIVLVGLLDIGKKY